MGSSPGKCTGRDEYFKKCGKEAAKRVECLNWRTKTMPICQCALNGMDLQSIGDLWVVYSVEGRSLAIRDLGGLLKPGLPKTSEPGHTEAKGAGKGVGQEGGGLANWLGFQGTNNAAK